MNTLKVIFYKAEGKWADKIIRWYTGSIYSHCELLLPDGRIFSADAWGGGVRFSTQYNLANWDVIEIPLTDYELKNLQDWCVYKENAKYDWNGVLRFILPFVKEDPRKWFCSELCAAAIKWIGKLPSNLDVHKLSPGDLFILLARK